MLIELAEALRGRHLLRRNSKASNARSRKEFTSSLGISYKESKESRYWLEIAGRSKLGDRELNIKLFKEADEICKILGKSIGKLRKSF